MQEPFLFNRDGCVRPRKTFYSAIDWKQKGDGKYCPTGSVGAQLIQCLCKWPWHEQRHVAKTEISSPHARCCQRGISEMLQPAENSRKKRSKQSTNTEASQHMLISTLFSVAPAKVITAPFPLKQQPCSRCLHFFHAERAEKLVHLNYGFNARAFKCVPRLFLCGGFYVTV